MISIQINQPQQGEFPDEVEIHLDQEGLQSLLSQLMFLKEGLTDHVHLMSQAWGGAHLTDQPLTSGSVAVRHVKVMLR
jgi:hypothetical protein